LGHDFVGMPRNSAACAGDVCHERVGVCVVEGGGDGVLLLKQKHIACSARNAVEFDTGAENGFVGFEESCFFQRTMTAFGESSPSQHVYVAQATSAVLERRLEHEGHFTRAFMSLGSRFLKARQPCLGLFAPHGSRGAGELAGQFGVASEVPFGDERGVCL
jgi:hypothetical protein